MLWTNIKASWIFYLFHVPSLVSTQLWQRSNVQYRYCLNIDGTDKILWFQFRLFNPSKYTFHSIRISSISSIHNLLYPFPFELKCLSSFYTCTCFSFIASQLYGYTLPNTKLHSNVYVRMYVILNGNTENKLVKRILFKLTNKWLVSIPKSIKIHNPVQH